MADPQHPASPRVAEENADVDRDERIETLLLSGLDHYFAGDHERAISVWTRVLFLDRGHARARAYIERARSAVAERQRESEELLHRGVAAFERGEGEAARRLFAAAVERGGPHDVALAYLDRLDRLETARATNDAAAGRPLVTRRARGAPAPRPARPRRSWVLPLLVVGLLGWGALYVATSTDWFETLPFGGQPWSAVSRPSPSPTAADPLPVPRPGELTLRRARSAAATGRLHEAMQLLAAISAADPLRPEADSLRSDIQQSLLSGSQTTATLGLKPGSSASEQPRVERDE